MQFSKIERGLAAPLETQSPFRVLEKSENKEAENLIEQGKRVKSSVPQAKIALSPTRSKFCHLEQKKKQAMVQSVKRQATTIITPFIFSEEVQDVSTQATDQSLKEVIKVSREKSAKNNKQKLRKQKKKKDSISRAQQKREGTNSLEHQAEQERVETVAKAYFTLAIGCVSRIDYIDDLKIAEDFRKNLFQARTKIDIEQARIKIGGKHASKRLYSFKCLSEHLSQVLAKKELEKYELCTDIKLGNFKSEGYTVPPFYKSTETNSYKKDSKKLDVFEKVHISILNKIYFKKDGQQYKLVGLMEVPGHVTDVQCFLNLCNIAPKTLNLIDCYVEQRLRVYTLLLLDRLKSEMTPNKVQDIFSNMFEFCLCDLRQEVAAGQKSPFTVQFEDSEIYAYLSEVRFLPEKVSFRYKKCKELVEKLLEASETLNYIDGMIEHVSKANSENAIKQEKASNRSLPTLEEAKKIMKSIPSHEEESWADIN